MSKKHGKPPPARRDPKDVQNENSILLDYILNDILTNGLVVQDPETGELLRTHPPAAHMRVALDRCRQLGLGPVLINSSKEANTLVEEARKRGLTLNGRTTPFPDADIDGEDYATRTSG